MKVYTNGAQTSISRHALSFMPYTFKSLFKEDEMAPFLGSDGKPLTIHVEFINGVAEVSELVGKILTHKEVNLASKSQDIEAYKAPLLNVAALAAAI
jgi:hypothetical protein